MEPLIVEPLIVEPLIVEHIIVEPLIVEPLIVEPLIVEPLKIILGSRQKYVSEQSFYKLIFSMHFNFKSERM